MIQQYQLLKYKNTNVSDKSVVDTSYSTTQVLEKLPNTDGIDVGWSLIKTCDMLSLQTYLYHF